MEDGLDEIGMMRRLLESERSLHDGVSMRQE